MDKYNYYAFISYCTKDEKWAKWLHSNLEKYHMPSALLKENQDIPKYIRPIFWYKTDLSGTNLSKSLEKELTSSRYLIVICSPASANSEWVNDEVKSFIKQGRTNQIIPFIVDGIPESTSPEHKCFVEALQQLPREESLRGIDVRTSGKQHALVDVIATMFGVRFDTLWQRHKRKQKQRNIIFSLVALLACVAALFTWDYNREFAEYYADYVDCYGIPEGIIPLDKDVVMHRSEVYKFTYERTPFGEKGFYQWRLKSIEWTNSKGQLLDNEGSQGLDRYPYTKYIYNKLTGKIYQIENYDSRKILQSRYTYSAYNGTDACIVDIAAGTADFQQGILAFSSYAFDQQDAKNVHAPITRLVYERNEKGYIEKVTYHSNNDIQVENSLTCDADEIYGIRYTLDSLGRAIQFEFLNKNLSVCDSNYIYSRKLYEFGTLGGYKSCSYLNDKNELVETPFGWAKFTEEFDEYGNIIEEMYYNAKGELDCHEDGVSRICYSYYDDGLEKSMKFYDTRGNKCISAYGCHEIRKKYDSNGYNNVIEFFDVNGKRCMGTEELDYSMINITYDKNGNEIARRYYDELNNLRTMSDGYAEWNANYDDAGNKIECFFYDASGHLSLVNNSYAGYKQMFDSNHRVVKKQFYDKQMKLTNCSEGYSIIKYKYDVLGNCIETSLYDKNNKPTICNVGFTRKICKYDHLGRLIEENEYDLNGKICSSK